MLTPREKEVMKLIAEGLSGTAIAQKLNISIKTVDTHRRKVLLKWGLLGHGSGGNVLLARKAIAEGYVEVPQKQEVAFVENPGT